MKAGLYFIGLMLFVLMFVMFDYSVRKDYLTMMKYKNNQNTNIVTEIAMQQPIAKPESMNLTALVDQMNKYKFDPDQGEEFIERLGQGLSADQIVYLGEVIRNSDETESRRNLALNLLAKNQGLKAFDEISSFLQFQAGSTNSEFEKTIRTEALELLATFSQKERVLTQLQRIYTTSESRFLKFQAGRIIEYLNPTDVNQPIEDQEGSKATR